MISSFFIIFAIFAKENSKLVSMDSKEYAIKHCRKSISIIKAFRKFKFHKRVSVEYVSKAYSGTLSRRNLSDFGRFKAT